ncbi:MAG TPA: YggS family pyridoxal phosphate-dependent enzyme [Vampirovibrionales bacterium]
MKLEYMSIEDNLQKLKDSFSKEIKLVAVSKTFDVEIIQQAYYVGQLDFAENKVQELLAKSRKLENLKDISWHFIGHLQSNKVKDLMKVPNLQMVHSVDRLKTANLMDKFLEVEGRILNILVQVNTSGEESKFGCKPEETVELVKNIAKLPYLRIQGLMTIGKHGGTKEETVQCFTKLRNISVEIQNQNIPNVSMKELSMGMSQDYLLALELGSTIIRIGESIFGERLTN